MREILLGVGIPTLIVNVICFIWDVNDYRKKFMKCFCCCFKLCQPIFEDPNSHQFISCPPEAIYENMKIGWKSPGGMTYWLRIPNDVEPGEGFRINKRFLHPVVNIQDRSYTFGEGPMGLKFHSSTDPQTIFVAAINPESAASKFATLEVGDVLSKAGSEVLRGLALANVMSFIRAQNRPLTLTFSKPQRSYTFDGPMGLDVHSSTDPQTGAKKFFVNAIEPGSAASKFSTLEVGDVLIMAGSIYLCGLDFEDLMSIIQAQTLFYQNLTLTFIKPLATDQNDSPLSKCTGKEEENPARLLEDKKRLTTESVKIKKCAIYPLATEHNDALVPEIETLDFVFLKCPPGVQSGSKIEWKSADGMTFETRIPFGVAPGEMFEVERSSVKVVL